MRHHGKMPWKLRLELFVADLDATADFYTRFLGFAIADDRRQADPPYLAVRRDQVRIGAIRSWAPVDRSVRAWPAGAEIVLEVDNITAERDRIVTQGWPLADDLKAQAWGLTDFRLYDPDGYYLRITSTDTAP
jgi:catechol 2,3-dioxygenase-like lactoylglutathione lyase family enzyme